MTDSFMRDELKNFDSITLFDTFNKKLSILEPTSIIMKSEW